MSFRPRQRYPLGQMPDGYAIFLFVPFETLQRLSTTCFRGADARLAGNFFAWKDFAELFRDCRKDFLCFAQDVLKEVSPRLKEGTQRSVTESYEFPAARPVGWTSTDRIEKYREEELEPFNPNRHSIALRVKKEFASVRPAPMTRHVTVVAQFRRDRFHADAWCMFIRSIYPGHDVGELERNVSRREKLIFFDFQHPGAAA